MRRAMTLAWLLLVPAVVLGGEPKAAETASSDVDLLEHKYEFAGKEQRDPFTIWKPQVVDIEDVPVVEKLGEEKPFFGADQGTGRTTAPVSTGPDPAELVGQARQYLFLGRHDAAMQSCNDALKILGGKELVGTAAIEESALRVLRAAERLKFRRETEEAFDKLPIFIKGIVWQPENSFAVINEKMAREGTIIEGGARVYKILPREVVFIYQGLKVSRKLYEEGKADAAKKNVKSKRSR